MLKHAKVITLMLITILVLSAWEGGLQGSQEEGMDFTEDEVADVPEDEGMDFSAEDEAISEEEDGFDFTEDEEGEENPEDEITEPEDDEGFDFDEDEDLEPGEDDETELPGEPVFPPSGNSTWLINYDGGQTVCDSGLTFPFEEGEPEHIEIISGEPPNPYAFYIENFDGTGGTLFFYQSFSVPFAFFEGVYEIPGTDEELLYEVYFDTSTGDGDVADIIYGTISNEAEGCLTTRDFSGNIVQQAP